MGHCGIGLQDADQQKTYTITQRNLIDIYTAYKSSLPM